ncbi:cobW-domain-containing protein [Ophiocordyceps camponoti-floridani]|uniref:CobW-domain-containing protein n=1 Tax=Ophiocordyceps camponoti-floridani TaxID=2030778 RepID=A0A8H4Q5J2_9HYPO|nr:cobW-domain-containing protein [Ophiocordyceps camponoti-floridani]
MIKPRHVKPTLRKSPSKPPPNDHPNPSHHAPPPIPITIITGFLGSGKTTLILSLIPQLLSRTPTYRLALIKNEFGDVAVDSQLASTAAITGVRELLGGCICCNLVGSLATALTELERDVRPDRIVIETSGSAFPATLALEVNRLARETGRYLLDGVVSVIDVENWKGYEDTSYTARLQARYTDLVVFNKWEEAGEQRYEECLDRLGDLEVEVATVKSKRGSVDADVIFGIDHSLAHRLTNAEAEAEPPTHTHTHNHQSEVQVLSVELRTPPPSPPTAASLPSLIKLLKAAPKDEVYRIKAIVSLSSTPRNSDEDVPAPDASARRYILNWAFGRWTFTALPDDQNAGDEGLVLHMTLILARYEADKWKKRLETGGLVESEEGGEAVLTVKRLL